MVAFGGSERIYNPQCSLQKQNTRASSRFYFLAEVPGRSSNKFDKI